MSTPSASELALLNTHPQRTQLYLSIYEPQVAMSCQVNGGYSGTTQSVPYDNVTEGNYLNIGDYYFQAALVGTSPGLEDVGRTWVRSATANTLRFVNSDHINWANDLYITVLKYTDIIPVFPRIIQNPADEEDVIFYKIWDVAYTNQNSILGAFVNMGSDFAGFLDGGECQVYWSASGTVHVLPSNLSYSWSFEGATVTGSTAHTPGYITYDTPGYYRTILTATGANGSVDTSIRYVSIHDRPDAGSKMPIMNFEFTEFSGSRDGVGYTCRVRIREPISEAKVKDGALVVVFKEDWYGYTKQSINKNDKGRAGILFVGYINGGTIQYNSEDGFVEFEVLSPTNLMEITECYSVSVENNTAPTTWYELLLMTEKRALYHYYRWHSTVLLCKDFTCNFTDKDLNYFDADRTSLYDAGNTLMSEDLRGKILSDSLGHIWAEQDVSVIDGAAASLGTSLSITKDDWIDVPIIDERHNDEVSFIELGGIAYVSSTNVSTALLSSAPGKSPGYRGKVEKKQGLALTDQAELNKIVGNLYAYRNSKYPRVELKLRGNYANLDIAPQEQIKLSVETYDTPRRITMSNKSFAIRRVSWMWDAGNQLLTPSIEVSEITQGFSGYTIVIPVIPPEEGEGGGTHHQPPITVPPIPVPGVTVTPSGVNIYLNGTFKGTVSDINFVGSIVDVVMTSVSGSSAPLANVIFDACGCSGTFSPGDYSAGLETSFYEIPWDETQFNLTNAPVTGFANGGFSVITGSSTFYAPYTGYYNLLVTDFRAYVNHTHPISGNDVDYTVTLHTSGLERTWSGNKTGSVCCNISSNLFREESFEMGDIFLQSGEEVVWYLEYSLTDKTGDHFENDTTFFVYMLCSMVLLT